jgi:hypothetical protein
MKVLLVSVAFGLGGLLSQGAFAETAAAHTALCKDGTYFDGATHKGACRGHQGVKEWLDAKSDAKDAKADDTKAAAKDTKATTAAASDEMVTCKDGTTSKAGRGACRGHKGVDKTAGAATAAPAAPAAPAAATKPAATSAPATTAVPAAAPATTAAPAATSTKSEKNTPPNPKDIAQKPGGGKGMVWVNSSSHVYHCEGDEWYGKTKEGSYMTEAAAKAEGDHGSHGKDCSAGK